MIEAAYWGLVSGMSLVVDAVLGLTVPASQRTIGLVMASGAGVLTSALTFELTKEAFAGGGPDSRPGRWRSSPVIG